MNQKSIISKSLFRSLLLAVGLMLSLVACKEKKKSAYILTGELFKEFKGTKELSATVTKTQEKQKYVLDSLKLSIRALETSGASTDKVNQQKTFYNNVLEEFTRNNQEDDKEYTDKVWKQLNQYLSEYGKEKGYEFIFGAEGTGNIMYADSTLNVTKDVLEFANKKYAGK